MKPAKFIAKRVIAALILGPLLYVLSVVPAVWALRHDFISVRQFFSLYRPLAPLANTYVGDAIDWYAFRTIPRVESCGGPSTFLQLTRSVAIEAQNADYILIDVVTDKHGTRYFVTSRPNFDSRPMNLAEIEALLVEMREDFRNPKDGLFVRVDPNTSFAEVSALACRMRETGTKDFDIFLADESATRANGEENRLVIKRDNFSRARLPLFLPEKQPR